MSFRRNKNKNLTLKKTVTFDIKLTQDYKQQQQQQQQANSNEELSAEAFWKEVKLNCKVAVSVPTERQSPSQRNITINCGSKTTFNIHLTPAATTPPEFNSNSTQLSMNALGDSSRRNSQTNSNSGPVL